MRSGWLVAALVVLGLCLVPGTVRAAESGDPGQGPKLLSNTLGMDFVLIRPGSFIMGSPPNEPGHRPNEVQHKVTISKPFYLQTTEVTLAQWRKVMGRRWLFPRQGPPDGPVTQVSWFDVRDFIAKLNQMGQGRYRLPSEAQWEYACRAGSTTAYFWGNRIDCSRAMFANNELKSRHCISYVKARGLMVNSPAPVKSYPPNPWGLYDMHGNVWEWVADWWGPYPRGPVTDPQGPPEGTYRVRRGGSWFRGPFRLRSANRNYADPASRYRTTGFRLVLEVR